MSPTPKSARAFHRKNRGADTTRNEKSFRVTATWPDRPDRPAIRITSDRAKMRRIANEFADQGAYVIVQRARGFQWRAVDALDGPARLAAAEAEHRQQLATEAAAARTARLDAEIAAQAAHRDHHRALDEAAEHEHLARLMTRPPVMRNATGRPTARHTAGERP
ncbi:hypothetical protein KVH22_21805 [Streptomyces olivaceus]|uniref:hypothetical protein n=1 Tax=Streptomyces olivaceus TaxID=47716 RepID=UPI001CCAB4D1|nr:hypothetical protein [Streptomyces olivaceus]MBZ6258155.1 hypothetical protein [Streptomyces olivaceus]